MTENKWTESVITFRDFTTQWTDKEYKLDPEHQRDVVHNEIWQSDIINSALKIGDVPQVYFHPRYDEDGCLTYESLDGKQRCSSICHFLNNKYTFNPSTTIPESYAECKGKKFNEFPQKIRQQLGRTKLSCKHFYRTMTDEEISEFFLTRQVTKVTTQGEKLNAQLMSNIRPQAIDLLARPTITEHFEMIKKSKNRKAYMELIARIMYAHRNSENDDLDPKQDELTNWFAKAPSFSADDLDQIENLIKRTITMVIAVPKSWDWKLSAKTTILPVYNILQRFCTGDDSESRRLVMTNRLKHGEEPIYFGGVNGDHNATNTRRLKLIEKCFP